MNETYFAKTFEEIEELEIKYNLTDNGMSGTHYGWHWYSDDEAGVDVYFKLDPDIPEYY